MITGLCIWTLLYLYFRLVTVLLSYLLMYSLSIPRLALLNREQVYTGLTPNTCKLKVLTKELMITTYPLKVIEVKRSSDF